MLSHARRSREDLRGPDEEPRPRVDDIQATLGLTRAARRRRHIWRWIGVVAVIAIAVAAALMFRSAPADAAASYQTDTVRQGALTVSVTATGELKSLTQVNIGTEISGVVESVGVDYNSVVTVGQILARVNTDKLEAQAGQARAALEAARAKQRQSQATLNEAQAQLAKLQNVRELSGGRVPSRQDMDSQQATVQRAEADVASAGAQVTQAEASLTAIDTDIRKAFIRSPINGIVLDRQIDPGQTVAASFQTPVLFTLAEDLTRMRLIVDVDEADIGMVRVGQDATFRVDAYPDRAFASRVTEIRSTPKTSNGVVTYQTVLSVDNGERLLRPGMTATATVTVNRVTDALLVPNAALRFTPPAATPQQGGGGFRLLPPPPGATRRDRTEDNRPRVWTLRDAQPVPVDVTVGPNDGKSTAVMTDGLKPGDVVIIDLATQ
jgi:HlyD family secretion protein